MPKITLPAGVTRVDLNGKYTAKEGDTVNVTPGQARQIKEKISKPGWKPPRFEGSVTVGTRKGRRCIECSFLGQAWSIQCPKCGGDTEVEE